MTDLITRQQLEANLHEPFMVALTFPQSRSYSYRAALAIATKADRYVDIDDMLGLVHFAGFEASEASARRALSILKYLKFVKGFQMTAGGRPVRNAIQVHNTLQCYIASFSVTDWKAHCLIVTRSPMPNEEKVRYVLPCRLAYEDRSGISRHHPSSVTDQLQAHAVRQGCEWCPRFDMKHFRTVAVPV